MKFDVKPVRNALFALAVASLLIGLMGQTPLAGIGSGTPSTYLGPNGSGTFQTLNITQMIYYNSTLNVTDIFAHPYSYGAYEITRDSGVYYAKNSKTGQVSYSGTDGVSVLQSVENILTSGGVVTVGQDFDGSTGWLNVTHSNVAIVSGMAQTTDKNDGTHLYTPCIARITIDSTAGNVKGLYLFGLNIRELDYQAINHVITMTDAQYCAFVPSSSSTPTYQGIVLNGTGTNGFIDYCHFDSCTIQDYFDQTVGNNNKGAITNYDTSNGGSGQLWFPDLDYHAHTANTVMWCSVNGSRLDQQAWFESLSYADLVQNATPFHLYGDSRTQGIDVGGGSIFEFHYAATVVLIDAGTNSHLTSLMLNIHDSHIDCGNDIPLSSADYNFTWNQALVNDWVPYIGSYISGNNILITTLGWTTNSTFSNGETGVCTNFQFLPVYEWIQGGTAISWYGTNSPIWTDSYTIYKSTGMYFAQNGTTGISDYSNKSAIQVIQSAVYALSGSSKGGTIILSPLVSAPYDTLTINGSFISLMTGMDTATDWNTGTALNTPCIGTIVINATSGTVRGDYIQGLNLREVDLYANNYVVEMPIFDKCSITPTSQTAPHYGIVINGTGTGFVDYAKFEECSIQDYFDQTNGTNSWGAITNVGSSSGGTGQIWFDDLDYHAHMNNTVFYCSETGSRLDSMVWFNAPSIADQYYNFTLIHAKASSKTDSINIENGIIQLTYGTNLTQIDSGSSATTLRFQLDFSGNQLGLGNALTGTTQAYNFTWNQAVSADYTAYIGSYIKGTNNIINTLGSSTNSTFGLGTVGTCANFAFTLGYENINNGVNVTYSDHGSGVFPSGSTSYSFPNTLGYIPTTLSVSWENDTGGRGYYWTANSTYITLTLTTPGTTQYITPTNVNLNLWDTAPTSTGNAIDFNFTSVTGWGTRNCTGAFTEFGKFLFDLGATYNVQLEATVGIYSNASSVNAYWMTSTDNSTWIGNSGVAFISKTATTEVVVSGLAEFANARYVGLEFKNGGASQASYVRIYDIRVINIDPSASASANYTFSWTAQP